MLVSAAYASRTTAARAKNLVSDAASSTTAVDRRAARRSGASGTDATSTLTAMAVVAPANAPFTPRPIRTSATPITRRAPACTMSTLPIQPKRARPCSRPRAKVIMPAKKRPTPRKITASEGSTRAREIGPESATIASARAAMAMATRIDQRRTN